MTVEPFPLAASDGIVDQVTDAVEAAGPGNHSIAFGRAIIPYVARWLTAGMSKEEVLAHTQLLGTAVAARQVRRKIEGLAKAKGDQVDGT